MIIDKNKLKQIILGSTLLGTGGGGNYSVAKKISNKFVIPVEMKNLNEIGKDDLFVTVFGVGGLKSSGDIEKTNLKNINLLKGLINKPIRYIVPVEIGPSSIANLFNIASKCSLSVIDTDVVGCRASPEIYLETVTLTGFDRCPLVTSNSEGDTIIIRSCGNPNNIESILRDFSIRSKTKVYVAGYPMCRKTVESVLALKSISYSMNLGMQMQVQTQLTDLFAATKKIGIEIIDIGVITTQDNENRPGFTAGSLTIKSKSNTYSVYYKNEYLVLLKNDVEILTCPDSIMLLDTDTRIGLNNADDNRNKNVAILGKKAVTIWRSPQGRKLFSPARIGYKFKQKLL